MIKHTLTLDYSLEPGWMEPFVSALQAGNAAAMHCEFCNLTSFPPIRTCTCGQTSDNWRTLSGRARLIHVCQGLDGHFAMVQFEGADIQSVVRLEGFDLSPCDRSESVQYPIGKLQPSTSATVALVLVPDDSMSTVT